MENVLKKGNYTVCLKYSEPYQGSAITVTAGQQQFATLIQPTAGWNEYHEKNLGVIRVPTTGETNISLQGIQLSLVKDEKVSWYTKRHYRIYNIYHLYLQKKSLFLHP